MGRKYVRKKTKYAGVYYIETTTNGRSDKTFYIRYKDEFYKDKELRIGKQSEGYSVNLCNAKRNEIMHKIKHGEELPKIANNQIKTKLTLNDIAHQYFEYRNVHNSTRSNQNEQYRYDTHLKHLFGNKLIYTISLQDIEKLQADKLKTLAPKTVNHITTLLGTIFNYAITKQLYKGNNPIQNLKKLSIDNKRERFLNRDEIKILMDEVRDNELLYLFCLLSLSTGGRATTIINIQKKHIDLNNRTVTLTDFKNKSTYKGFITTDMATILKEHISTLKTNDNILRINNKPISISQIQKRLKPILDKLFNEGLDVKDAKNRVVIHTFRHSFASNLAIGGTPIYTIQKLMNHRDINMTLRYAKLSPESGRDMVENIMKNIY